MIIGHLIHPMRRIIVEQDFLLLPKQHQLLPQLIHDNRLAVLLNQVNRTVTTNSIAFQYSLVESMCAVTEENNKKNTTSDCSEQRIILYVIPCLTPSSFHQLISIDWKMT